MTSDSLRCVQSLTDLPVGDICTFMGVVKHVSRVKQSTGSDVFYTIRLFDDDPEPGGRHTVSDYPHSRRAGNTGHHSLAPFLVSPKLLGRQGSDERFAGNQCKRRYAHDRGTALETAGRA